MSGTQDSTQADRDQADDFAARCRAADRAASAASGMPDLSLLTSHMEPDEVARRAAADRFVQNIRQGNPRRARAARGSR